MENTNLSKTYNPKDFEARLYKKWMDEGYFKSKPNPDKKPFTIMMPPPNITGQLHMGHALDHTLQDILSDGNVWMDMKLFGFQELTMLL